MLVSRVQPVIVLRAAFTAILMLERKIIIIISYLKFKNYSVL